MIARIGEVRQDKLTSGTYGGVYVNTYLVAKVLNTQISGGDFNPTGVNVKILLRRNGQNIVMMQDNLLILGTYASLKRNYHEFINGFDKVIGTATERAVKLRTCYLDFGGFVRLEGDDELIMEVVPAQNGTLSANVDMTESYIEFYANPGQGYETFIPIVTSQVVQQNTSKQPFNPGDNVLKVAFLNFDMNDLKQEVITNFTLSSDKLDHNFTFNQLLAHDATAFGGNIPSRYGTSVPISATSPTVVRGLNYLPQSFLIHDAPGLSFELDQVRLDISFNSSYVNSSQNYVVYTKYLQSPQQVVRAAEREAKHQKENMQKIAAQKTSIEV